jgi:dinuclear metal center YbgI/SA1388 family protein
MQCQEICDRLDEKLNTAAYADVDPSANGLQVGSGEREVEHVAAAVDAAVETVERAATAGADLLLTHHGIFWGDTERLTGRQYDRVAALFEGDMSLYTAHLPLDGHATLGNAAHIANLLDLEGRDAFGDHGGRYVGQMGTLPDPLSIETVVRTIHPHLDTGGHEIRVLNFGPDPVLDVAIVTGSGTDFVDEAVAAGADVLITGEGKQQVYHEAREHGIHVVLAGHYATETFGVRAIADLTDGWGMDTTFVDCPTGL